MPISKPYKQIYIYLAALNFQKLFIDHTHTFPHTDTQSFHLYYCLQSLSTYIYAIISFVLLFTESFHIHLRNHFICIIVYRVFPHTYTQSFHLYYCLQNLPTRSFYFFVFVCDIYIMFICFNMFQTVYHADSDIKVLNHDHESFQ